MILQSYMYSYCDHIGARIEIQLILIPGPMPVPLYHMAVFSFHNEYLLTLSVSHTHISANATKNIASLISECC